MSMENDAAVGSSKIASNQPVPAAMEEAKQGEVDDLEARLAALDG